jgi:cell division protein FtsI/penicillin-binding protein 2
MFENRLKWFSILLGAVALVIVARLAQIQIVRAAHYEQLASRILTRPVRYLPAVRGSILDRNGRPLVRDVPASDIGVHYAVLSGDSADYLYAVAREMRERGPRPRSKRVSEIVTDLRGQIAGMWPRLAQLAGVPESELMEHRDEIRRRVERIRESVSRRRGVLQPIAEEYAMHPVLESVDDDMALAVRMEMRWPTSWAAWAPSAPPRWSATPWRGRSCASCGPASAAESPVSSASRKPPCAARAAGC